MTTPERYPLAPDEPFLAPFGGAPYPGTKSHTPAAPAHTPGPWEAGTLSHSDYGLEEIDIRHSYPGYDGGRHATVHALHYTEEARQIAEANARLIAAAPDLLEACNHFKRIPWVHNAALTNDIEALRTICLAWSNVWNNHVVPALEKATGE